MYALIVIALMLVIPIGCTIYDVFHANGGLFSFGILMRWLVFWAVGVRLLLAGFRQIFKPGYTAEVILRIKGDECRRVIRELGFGNVAIGCIGIGCLYNEGWLMPAAIAGTVLYSLAGVNHFLHKARGMNENVAMVTDVLVAAVLIICLLPS